MGFIKKFKNSLYNFSSYNVFLKQSLGKSVVYLLLLTLVLSFFGIIATSIKIHSGVTEFTTFINDELPNFEFKNGEFSCDGTMPIIYDEDGTVLIIDTSESANKNVLKDYKSSTQAFLITKNELYQQTAGSIKTTDLKDLKGLSFNKNSITDKIPSWEVILILVVAICIPIGSFIGNLFVAYIVIGLGGLIISSILHKELKYSEVVRLGIYSLTIPLIINTLWNIIGISFPFSTRLFLLLYLGIAFTYLTLGFKALDENSYKENIFYQAPEYNSLSNNQGFNNQSPNNETNNNNNNNNKTL